MSAQNGLTVSGANAHISGQDLKVSSDGTTFVATIEAASGNTDVSGTLTATLGATFNNGMEVAGAGAHANAQNFVVTSDGTTNKFAVVASSGNTDIEGNFTFGGTVMVSGDIQANEIRATNGAVVSGAAAHASHRT